MNKQAIVGAATVAVLLIAAVAFAYRLNFGSQISELQEVWGQFGDFFGGVLNPLFAMLAFLALLWSINLQAKEFQRSAEQLSKQSALAQKQLEDVNRDRLNQELLHVIKDIDRRLTVLLENTVSPPGATYSISIAMMVAESERLARYGGSSASYTKFVEQARTQGSVVEAPVREIALLVAEMRSFLEQLSLFRAGAYAPVVVYYANKVHRLVPMLEDIGRIPPDTRKFFATVGDLHR